MAIGWDDDELRTLTRVYLEMLKLEHEGVKYVKADYNRHVQALTGRGKSSIEFKLANMSGVLDDLGLDWIQGYVPRFNYQAAMVPIADELVDLLYPALRSVPKRREATRASTEQVAEAARERVSSAHVPTPDTEPERQYLASGSSPEWQHRAADATSEAHFRTSGAPVAASSDKDSFLGVLDEIWGKAAGGSDVAVSPDAGKARFDVAPLPGVLEASDWLKGRVVSGSSPGMVFLVGGPGNGKSHALDRLTEGLSPINNKPGGLAKRSYKYESGRGRLMVVNDASIPIGDDKHPLADDIDRTVRDGESIFACVNRGVLVEEANALESDTAGSAVVRWLADLPSVGASHRVEKNASGPFLARARLVSQGRTIEIVVVQVDHCSLLEPRPQATSELAFGPYKVTWLKKRAELDLRTLPAGQLLGDVVDALFDPGCVVGDNPVIANVVSLESAATRRGLLTVLRASEAVTGSRLGFREVWGAILRCLVGDFTRDNTADDLEAAFPPIPEGTAAVDRFVELQRRAAYRFSQAIFGVGVDEGRINLDPVLRQTSMVDPILDAVPGKLTDPGLGWASPVLDSFTGLVSASSPLQTLLSTLPAEDGFHVCVTDFDQLLDDAFVKATRAGEPADGETTVGPDEKTRRAFVSWYGDYLSRLYAVSNGVPAFLAEVEVWLRTRGGSSLPSAFETSLKTLLRPLSEPEKQTSDYLLPVFNSRTVPYTGAISSPRIALKAEAGVSLERVGDGESVRVKMLENGVPVGDIELDFPLIRSAVACSEQRLGTTDQAPVIGPRVERFRAKRLTSARVKGSKLRLLGPAGQSDIDFEEND